jgi:phenylpropionate dioxygenase-like ring-hydroxylating dioxygenase large terminal subunit
MLSHDTNEMLCRVGPGTPMGEMMREYWIPACASSELQAEGAPMRLLLLGEKLVAFRDSTGRVGIMDHQCPHRCASLFFGRNEADGLRCIYHGWKFDVDGNCLDMPNVPPHQEFSSRAKAKAYRTFEHNGLVWAYMGKRELPPPLPALETMFVPADELRVVMMQRECNWLQGLESSIDTSHFGFLHLGHVHEDDVDPESIHKFALIDRAPEYYTAETDWGTMYAAYRPAGEGGLYYRFAHFALPFWTLIPDGSFEDNIIASCWVPMDDTHTMTFNMIWQKRTSALRTMKDGRPIPGFEVLEVPYRPNTSDWCGRWLPSLNAANEYGHDRAAQRDHSYSGLVSVGIQDQAIFESMGALMDRTNEHLAMSDRMVTLTRRRLLAAVKAHSVSGATPPSVDQPEAYRGARGGSCVAPEGLGWLDVYAQRLAAAFRPTGDVKLSSVAAEQLRP